MTLIILILNLIFYFSIFVFGFKKNRVSPGSFIGMIWFIGSFCAIIYYYSALFKYDYGIRILPSIELMPFSPTYISHKFTKYTYPIQDVTTRTFISEIKNISEKEGLYLSGRFAEWEYYNMDAAMGAAMDLNKNIFEYE
jgi:hypothetical protein